MAGPSRSPDRELGLQPSAPAAGRTAGSRATGLAEALGIHYQTIGYIERGEYSPSLHLALRIARFFDLPVEAVFSLEPFGPLRADALMARPDVAID